MNRMRSLTKTPVDSGYSWVILLAGTFANAIVLGTMKLFGILYNEFLLYYGTSYGNTAWVGSIAAFLSLAIGPVSNYLCEVYSFRTVVFCGGVLYGVGLCTSFLVTKMEILYITIGVIAGTGVGLIVTPTFTIISFYFEKRRTLANGIYLCGSSIAVIFLSPFYKFLIDLYGVHGTLLILGGLVSNVCVVATLFKQPSHLRKYKDVTSLQNDAAQKLTYEDDAVETTKCADQEANKQPSTRRFFDVSLFKNSPFCTIVLAYTICSFAFMGIFTVLPAQVAELGYGKANVAVLFSIYGGVEIFAKLSMGYIVDLAYFKPKHIFCVLMTLGGVFALGISFFHQFHFYVIYTILLAIFPIHHFILLPGMMLKTINIGQLPNGMGLTAFFCSLAYLLSSPITGWIKDATGTWDYSFRFIAAMYILAAIGVILQPLIFKNNKNKLQK